MAAISRAVRTITTRIIPIPQRITATNRAETRTIITITSPITTSRTIASRAKISNEVDLQWQT